MAPVRQPWQQVTWGNELAAGLGYYGPDSARATRQAEQQRPKRQNGEVNRDETP